MSNPEVLPLPRVPLTSEDEARSLAERAAQRRRELAAEGWAPTSGWLIPLDDPPPAPSSG